MAFIRDLWHKSKPEPDEPRCAGHGKVPTSRHGFAGRRWLVAWVDGGRDRSKCFAKRSDAEWHMAHLAGAWCLVPRCGTIAATEPPVLLCGDHRDLLVQQVTRKRPKVHEPVVYFIRNGSRVKIGWTTNLPRRLTALSLPASAVALLVPGGPPEEDMLHRKFRRTRVGGTEWFDDSDAIEDYIAQHQPKPDAWVASLLSRVRGERAEVVEPAA